MSQVAPLPTDTTGNRKSIKAGEAFIRGRIHAKRVHRGENGVTHVTLVKLPAPDPYSSAQTIEVLSKTKLGEAGDDIEGFVRIGGFGRSYVREETDNDTGEVRKVRVPTADNKLHWVTE